MILSQGLLILGIIIAGYAIYLACSAIFDSIFNVESSPLQWATAEVPQKSKSGVIRIIRPLLHKVIIPLISRYKLKDYKEKIKRNIQSSGLAAELNEEEYVALQALLGLIFPLLLITLNILFETNYHWLMIVGFGLFGIAYPYLYVKSGLDGRKQQIMTDLPFVVDLLALSTEAGLDFIGAISKVVEKMPQGPLSEELAQVLRDLKLGSSRAEALSAMSWRLNMTEITSFIAVLITADSLGASIGGVLRQQSEQMRQERFTKAEKLGAQASQKIFLPLIFFILPAVLLIVFGPVIIQFMGG